jgi:hypothetical protein
VTNRLEHFEYLENAGNADERRCQKLLEHFPAKWKQVRVAKMRQNNDVELLFDSTGSESALEHFPANRIREPYLERAVRAGMIRHKSRLWSA